MDGGQRERGAGINKWTIGSKEGRKTGEKNKVNETVIHKQRQRGARKMGRMEGRGRLRGKRDGRMKQGDSGT